MASVWQDEFLQFASTESTRASSKTSKPCQAPAEIYLPDNEQAQTNTNMQEEIIPNVQDPDHEIVHMISEEMDSVVSGVPLVIPSVASAIVEDLTTYTDQQLADKLPNIDINFTCKVCLTSKSSLKELVLHLESGCKPENTQIPTPLAFKRGRGRPRKNLLSIEKTESPVPMKKILQPKIKPANEITVIPDMPGRHTTRMATGSIKRKNAAELLGLNIKTEPDEEETEHYQFVQPDKTVKMEPGTTDSEAESELSCEQPKAKKVVYISELFEAVKRARMENSENDKDFVISPEMGLDQAERQLIQSHESQIKDEGTPILGNVDDPIRNTNISDVIPSEPKRDYSGVSRTIQIPGPEQDYSSVSQTIQIPGPERDYSSVSRTIQIPGPERDYSSVSRTIQIPGPEQDYSGVSRTIQIPGPERDYSSVSRTIQIPGPEQDYSGVSRTIQIPGPERDYSSVSRTIQIPGPPGQSSDDPDELELANPQNQLKCQHSEEHQEPENHTTQTRLLSDLSQGDSLMESENETYQPKNFVRKIEKPSNCQTKVLNISHHDSAGRIVIPTSSSGNNKQIIIPHSLLLEAVREHKLSGKSGAAKIVIKTEPKDENPNKSEVVDEDNDKDFDSALDLDSTDQGDDEYKPSFCASSGRPRGRPKKITNNFFEAEKKSRPFHCLICVMRYFATEEELNIHLECHVYTKEIVDAEPDLKAKNVKRDEYKCPACGMPLNNWGRVLRHLLLHDGYKTKLENTVSVKNIFGSFTCPACKKQFDKKCNLIVHFRKVHNKVSRTCEICNQEFSGMDDRAFQRHVDKCKDIDYQCEQCHYTTKISMNMTRHMKVHTGEGFVCEICAKAFPTKQRYEVHRQRHKENRPRYPCSTCEQTFLTVDALKKHTSRFHAEQNYEFFCTKCSYVARLEIDLTKHMKMVHDKKYKCTHGECPYQSNSQSAFEQHMEYHLPDRVHPCQNPGCYYSGITAKQLTDHAAQVHMVNSKHQCPICQKFFKKKTHLLRHLVCHTGDQPYMCVECERTFYSHSTYYRHRAKTGHDAKREGIASVPQNIVITYVQDDEKDEALIPDADEHARSQNPSFEKLILEAQESMPEYSAAGVNQPLGQEIGQNPSSSLTFQTPITTQNPDGSEQVVFVETSESQFLEDINSGTLHLDGQNIHTNVPGTNIPNIQTTSIETTHSTEVGHLDNSNGGQMIGLQPHMLPIPAETYQDIDSDGQVLENMITIPEGQDGEQYTYILSAEQAEMLAGGQLALNLPDQSTNPAETPLDDALSQEVVYETLGEENNVETVVEVSPPGGIGEQQFAILLVPSSESEEPQAALSMLQLQSSS